MLGVIQAINKLSGFFTKEDEGLLAILANLAGTVLLNSLTFDEQSLFHSNLRHVLRVIPFPFLNKHSKDWYIFELLSRSEKTNPQR